jgi:hypothetical protein
LITHSGIRDLLISSHQASFGDRIGLIDFSLEFNSLRRTKFEQRGCREVDLDIVVVSRLTGKLRTIDYVLIVGPLDYWILT